MLALSFLLVVGVALVAEGFEHARAQGLHLLRDGVLGRSSRCSTSACARRRARRCSCASPTPARRRTERIPRPGRLPRRNPRRHHAIHDPGRHARRRHRHHRARPPRQGQRDQPADVAGDPAGDGVARRDAGCPGRYRHRQRQVLLRRDRPRVARGDRRHGARRLRRPQPREAAPDHPRPAGHADLDRALPQAGARRDPGAVHRRRRRPGRGLRHALLLGQRRTSASRRSTSA